MNTGYNYVQTEPAKTEQVKKSNLLKGFVGALLGAMIGAVMLVLIYRLGYIAGMAGLVAAVCAFKGYEFLGGCLDRKGVIISIVCTLIVLYLGNKIAWAWEAYDALSELGYTFADCFRNLGAILEGAELTSGYYTDLVICYVLTLGCSIRPMITALKGRK